MSETTLLLIGAVAFVMMVIGLVLTMREFAAGEPKQQDRARAHHSADDRPSSRARTA